MHDEEWEDEDGDEDEGFGTGHGGPFQRSHARFFDDDEEEMPECVHQ